MNLTETEEKWWKMVSCESEGQLPQRGTQKKEGLHESTSLEEELEQSRLEREVKHDALEESPEHEKPAGCDLQACSVGVGQKKSIQRFSLCIYIHKRKK